MSFPAVSSAPISTSREVTRRAPRLFSSWVALDFEGALDIGEEVGGEGEALTASGAFKYLNTLCVQEKDVNAYRYRDPTYHGSGDQSA